MRKDVKALEKADIELVINKPLTILWSCKDVGFGQFYFYKNSEDAKIHCDNECMSRAFIKKILCDMVDNAVMDDPSRFETDEENNKNGG